MEENNEQIQTTTEETDLFLEELEDAPGAAAELSAQAEEPAAEAAGDEGGDSPDTGKAVETETAATRTEADIQADLASFATAFPEVFARAKDDPGVIPQCVWDAMHSQGLSLTAAYARYVTDQAKTAAGNQGNAARSTGSMRSAGNDRKNDDAFLSAFEA